MISKFDLIENLQNKINITENQTLGILSITDSDLNKELDITVNKGVKFNLFVSLLSVNKTNNKLKIDIHLDDDDADVEIYTTCLAINESNNLIEVNGISNKKNNSKINIQIHGILDSNKAKIKGIPKFIFNHNQIDAKHGLTIGALNRNELNYLQSRCLDLEKCKFILVSSKIFRCLNVLDEKQKNNWEEKILNKWKEKQC